MKGVRKFAISLLIISIIQIILLLFFPAAQSYLIGSVFEEVSAQEQDNQTGYDSESSLKTVGKSFSGETICCPETNEGAICQNIHYKDIRKCSEDVLPTDCSNSHECELGCCIDTEEGICSTKSTPAECNSLGGKWKDQESCLVEECQKNCCVLGNDVKFVTEKRCEKISSDYGFKKDFRQLGGELECLALAANRKEGACKFSSGICQMLTEKSCLKKGGDFSEGYLCTSEELNTSCEPTNQTTCLEGKEEVYFLDSCGNRGNIYDSSKIDNDKYWEKIISKEESCNSSSNNVGSKDCGNCNRYVGSTCSNIKDTDSEINPDYGNNYCMNLNCGNAPDVVDASGNVLKTRDRVNGESWCVYDSEIGEGLDTVGSRHWKYYCQDGEVVVEGCPDYRQGICIESEMRDGTKTFSQANCKLNTWTQCLSYNGEIEVTEESKDYSKMQKKCNENQDCYIKEMDFGKGYHLFTCLPKYPPGFQLSATKEKATDTCDMADFECTKIKVKKLSGWDCVAGCECDSLQYTQEMNDWCRSLGDCGGYVNIAGKEEEAYTSSDSEGIDLEQYKKYVKPKNQNVNANDYSLGQLIGKIAGKNPETAAQKELMESQKTVGLMNTISGASSGILMAAGWAGQTGVGIKIGSQIITSLGWEVKSNAISSWAGGVSSAAIAGGVMTAVSYLAIELFGLEGQAAMIISVVTTILVVANAGAAMLGVELLGAAGFCGPLAWICAVVIVVIAALLSLFGIGDKDEDTYVFNCMAWQPSSSNDCYLCNNNPLKPCSQYRCASLGSACQLINENTENPICEKIVNDGTAPRITSGKVPEGFEFKPIKINKSDVSGKGIKIQKTNGNCIPEFTPVNFTLETNEYAQCKMSGKRTDNFESMENYLAGNNRFMKEHEAGIFMPSIDSLKVYNVTGNVKESYGNMKIYVRCQDVNGNKNIDEYGVKFCIRTGEDLTAARPIKFVPKTESYLKYGENNSQLKMYINEPAECRYDVKDMAYENMSKDMSCSTKLQRQTSLGWTCETNLEISNESVSSEKQYYIKCKDQPWLKGTENESKRNINSEGFIYTIKYSESELEIDSISPQKGAKIEAGYLPYPINLKATTKGGSLNGKSTCYYKFSENGSYSQFLDTNKKEHEQKFDKIMGEEYEIFVKCEDVAGNIAENKTNFKLNIDEQAPKIVRLFNQNGKLNVITDEKAKCYYSLDRCNFNMESNSSKVMTTAYSKEHNAQFSEKTYYIKCKDVWSNTNSGCAAIARKVNFGTTK